MRGSNTKRQQGITLVELMVSIAVGLILLSGIISIFISNKQAYRLQESTNVLNENARYALNQIQYHLRMGDHWGGVEVDSIELDAPLGGVVITGDCAEAATLTALGFVGFEGDSLSPLACIPASDYVVDSDILVIRYGEPERVWSSQLQTDPGIFVRTAIGRRAILFQGTNVGALPTDIRPATPYPVKPAPEPTEFANFEFQTVIYFIRKCASQDRGDTSICDADDDTTPTLTRLVLDGPNLTLLEEDVVAGVEQMQIRYGVLDETQDPPLIEYKDATTITAANDWGRVESVQISMILRGEQFDATFTDTRTFNMYGGFSYTPAAADSHFRRKLFNFVVQIRNLTRA